MFVHSSSGRYGADRQLELIVTRLERYEPLVALPDSGPLADRLQAAGTEVIVRPLAVIRRELASPQGAAAVLGGAVRDAAALGRVIRARQIAIVHSNTSVVLSGAAAAGLARVPHVWHVREIYSRHARVWPAYRRLMGTAAAIPCVSAATAAQFESDRRVSVLYDGLLSVPARTDRGAARAALGIPADAPAIAIVGRVSDWKGQDVLVRALAQRPLRDALVLVAGDPWPGAEERLERVAALAVSLGVSERVHFLGFRQDISNVYGAADLVAVPSTEPDPLPGAAIEAAAAGCAVIASDLGGLREIIGDGETGRLLAANDPAALAKVARELLDDPLERERLGAAAARDVRERFAPQRLIDSVQLLYDAVL